MDPHQDVVSLWLKFITPNVSQLYFSGRVTLGDQVLPTGRCSRAASIHTISLRHNLPFYTPNIPLLTSQSQTNSLP